MPPVRRRVLEPVLTNIDIMNGKASSSKLDHVMTCITLRLAIICLQGCAAPEETDHASMEA